MPSQHETLSDRTQSFCRALLDPAENPPEKILEEHFSTRWMQITEHGPAWATKSLPFLGRPFSGRDQCIEYFTLLTDTLECQFDGTSLMNKDAYIIDTSTDTEQSGGGVSLVGTATFQAKKTGKEWKEKFIYRLSFDDEGRIAHWEIWADPLSAWFAVKGDAS